jgi:hypothetical protein
MKKIVIMAGGYHPFHAGHYSLYKAAQEKFPDADVYLAATNDTKTRPFPFEIKKKLAQLAGVNPDQFVQVKSPFKAEEITQKYDPEQDVLIFVRSEKDRDEQPKPGGTKKDGSPSYFQPYDPNNLESFNKHAYIEYLPTIEFGPGITSASEIRNAWHNLNERQKLAMVMSLYPRTQQNKKLADVAVKMLDAGIIGDAVQGVSEGGAETSWSDDEDTITLQDILDLTNHIKQINLPINDNLKSKLIHWDGNPEEIERINQVTVSKQFPILVMLDEKGQIDWILDGNHRLHKAIQSQAETIPAKLIKPGDLSDKAKKIFYIRKQGVDEATLINDPEQGHLIVPDGGMGTWDEKSLLSNLIRKFSSMAEMIKEKRYSNLYHSLYEAGVVENMLKALIQYENFKEKQGNRPIAKGKKIELKEIDFSSGLDDRNFSVKKILEIGKVVGQIEGYNVVKATAGSQKVYFLVSDDKVHSLIGFDNGYLKNIKNVSKQSGVVRALLGYLVHIQKQPIEISHTEPLTSDGLRWVIHLIEKPRGLVITNQDNEPINVEELKNEWDQATETGNPGTTSITITEDTKFGNKIRTNESYRHSDSLLMPFIFYTKNQDYLTEK